MKIIYKIFNPAIGEYVDTGSMEECTKTFAELACQFYLSHTHGTPISIVVEDEGVETWRNMQGTEIVNPELVQQQILEQLEIL